MAFKPFIDDPAKREERLRNAPKAHDKYGNVVVKIGHYWCSSNFERICQLADNLADDEWIIICRTCDGRFFSKQKRSLSRKKGWSKSLASTMYMFVDPESQEVY